MIAVVTTRRESFSAIVVDVSATGAKLHGANLPALDEELNLTIDGLVVFGFVAWEGERERGISFDTRLAAVDENRLRQKVAEAKGLPPAMKAAFDDWALGLAR